MVDSHYPFFFSSPDPKPVNSKSRLSIMPSPLPFPITIFLFLVLLLLFLVDPCLCRKPHNITFRSPNLFPESAAWDPSAQHFLLGSTRRPSLHSVSDAGVVETVVPSDPDLPHNNLGILGVAVDSPRGRLLAVVSSLLRSPYYSGLAAYDLRSGRRLFLSLLSDDSSQVANGVTVDPSGNAFITCSLKNLIWKVDTAGAVTVFSKSPILKPGDIGQKTHYSWCGLNGIAYARNGYLLTVQTSTGKLFKVDATDGTARLVLLSKELSGADGISIMRDGSAVVVAQHRAWLLKSSNAWAEAVVDDEVALDEERYPTGVVTREGDRAYALYGLIDQGMKGNDRDEFSIEEIEWEKEREGDGVWVFVLLGLGMCYFLYWRFQMGQLVKNMNKKRA